MYKRISRILHVLIFLILIGICGNTIYFLNNKSSVMSTISPMAIFTRTPVPSLPHTVETRRDRGWSLIQPGFERHVINIYDDQNQRVESLYIWRLDQKYFRMDVAFDETPRSLETWQNETHASLVLNGGYFSIVNERYFPDGLTIVNGEASGQS